MWLVNRQTGIVNVRMVITEEKIISNIDKVQKMINPNSKKQIVQLEEDGYFKDLIESIKTYLIEYPKKKNFPNSVYKAAYGLVEYATEQFEENTKKIEELIRQREENITLAGKLKSVIEIVENKDENWKDVVEENENEFSEDILDILEILGNSEDEESQDYVDAKKLLNARVNNLESNLYIEIDMERIEDRSKALSYIGIEIADALKTIPAPVETVEETQTVNVEPTIVNEPQTELQTITEQQEYIQETTFEAKPSLWERVKRTKIGRAVNYILRIRIRVELPSALPEGRGESQY